MSSDARIRRARLLIDAPFRLHGRAPETGIDCVGLIALAIRRARLAPTGYALRGGTAEGWRAMLDAAASRRRGAWRAGDVLLMRAGPMQFHLGIWTGESMIHADARLRRVIETPGDPQWPVLGAWGRAKGRG